jgi:hypothetical protein
MKEHKISFRLVGEDVISLTISVGRSIYSLGRTREQMFLKRQMPTSEIKTADIRDASQYLRKFLA